MVKSTKGKEINMEQLVSQNKSVLAIGNARMNANGDLVGKGGKIVKTKEDLAREYHKSSSSSVKNVPVSSEIQDMFKRAKQVKKELIKDNKTVSETKKDKKEDANKIKSDMNKDDKK